MKDRPNQQNLLKQQRELKQQELSTELDAFLNIELRQWLTEDFSALSDQEKSEKAETLLDKVTGFEKNISRFFDAPVKNNLLMKLWNENINNYYLIFAKLGDPGEEHKNSLIAIYVATMEDVPDKETELKASVSKSIAALSDIQTEIKDFNKQLEEKLSIEHSGWTDLNKRHEVNAIMEKMNSLNTKINESNLSSEQRNAVKKSLWDHHRLPTSSNPHRGEPVVIQVMEKVSTPSQLNLFKQTRDLELQKIQPKNISQQPSSKNNEQDKRKKMAMEYGKKTLKAASYLTVPTLIGHAIYHGVKKGMKEWEKRKKPEPKDDTTPKMRKK